MVRLPPWLGICTACLSLALSSVAARADTACTFDQMQINSASVIAPCSDLLDKGALADPEKAQAFYVRGRAYARTGRTLLAAQDFDVALKLAPDRSDIWVSRAHAEAKLGRWDDEWNDLQRALALNPRDARAWFAVGQVYQNAGDDDQALTSYGQALAADPFEPYSLMNRSDILASRHRYPEALADATALVNIPPATINKLGYIDNRGIMTNFHVVALNHRAALYAQMGDQIAAGRDLDSAVADQPSGSTFRQRAEWALQANRSEQALADIEEAARLDPAEGDIQYVRGQALAGLGRYAEGLDAFDKALDLHRKVVVTPEQVGFDFMMRARMLRGLGKTDDAVASLAKAVAISPEIQRTTLLALNMRGYWANDGTPAKGDPFTSALRACMIDKDCN